MFLGGVKLLYNLWCLSFVFIFSYIADLFIRHYIHLTDVFVLFCFLQSERPTPVETTQISLPFRHSFLYFESTLLKSAI